MYDNLLFQLKLNQINLFRLLIEFLSTINKLGVIVLLPDGLEYYVISEDNEIAVYFKINAYNFTDYYISKNLPIETINQNEIVETKKETKKHKAKSVKKRGRPPKNKEGDEESINQNDIGIRFVQIIDENNLNNNATEYGTLIGLNLENILTNWPKKAKHLSNIVLSVKTNNLNALSIDLHSKDENNESYFQIRKDIQYKQPNIPVYNENNPTIVISSEKFADIIKYIVKKHKVTIEATKKSIKFKNSSDLNYENCYTIGTRDENEEVVFKEEYYGASFKNLQKLTSFKTNFRIYAHKGLVLKIVTYVGFLCSVDILFDNKINTKKLKNK